MQPHEARALVARVGVALVESPVAVLPVQFPLNPRRLLSEWHDAAFTAVNERRLSCGEAISVACRFVYDEMKIGTTWNVESYSFLKIYRRYIAEDMSKMVLASVIDGDIDIAIKYLELCNRSFKRLLLDRFPPN